MSLCLFISMILGLRILFNSVCPYVTMSFYLYVLVNRTIDLTLWFWDWTSSITQSVNRSLCLFICISMSVNPFHTLKWSFTHKQDAWEPPQNHSWKINLWPFQTEILKINAGFAKKKVLEKVEMITKTPAGKLRSLGPKIICIDKKSTQILA